MYIKRRYRSLGWLNSSLSVRSNKLYLIYYSYKYRFNVLYIYVSKYLLIKNKALLFELLKKALRFI